MSGQDRISAELWLEICDLLLQNAIRALSLTSRTLRLVSRPLLFAHFDFHTWTPVAEDSSTLIDDSKLDCYLERLAFFSCGGTVPLVRSCSITPWRPRRLLAPAGVTFAETLLPAFVEHLLRVIGLQRLFAEDVDFTPY
ncbi:hypothetical protein FB451DRAFT_1412522 [Mycena latifolia]|nr:hypothetical protein FB451DRAFT_1412522 [Mycena latifolia]